MWRSLKIATALWLILHESVASPLIQTVSAAQTLVNAIPSPIIIAGVGEPCSLTWNSTDIGLRKCAAGLTCQNPATYNSTESDDPVFTEYYRQAERCSFCEGASPDLQLMAQCDGSERGGCLDKQASHEGPELARMGECFECEPGEFCPTGSLNLVGFLLSNQCPPGFYCPNSAEPKLPCEVGHFCPHGSRQQIPCTAQGTYCPATGQPFDDGQGLVTDSYVAAIPGVLCPVSHYCPNTSSMLICPRGEYCLGGRTESNGKCQFIECPEGSSAPIGWAAACLVLAVITFIISAITLAINCYKNTRQDSTDGAYRPLGAQPAAHGPAIAPDPNAWPQWSFPLRRHHPLVKLELQNINCAHIVTNLDLVLGPGLTFVMGPSGSGKSTALEVLSGRFGSTTKYSDLQGRINVTWQDAGINVRASCEASPHLDKSSRTDERVWRLLKGRIGWCAQSDTLHENMSCLENIQFLAQLAGVENPAAAAEQVLEWMNLPRGKWKAMLGTLSGGMRRRVSVAAALVGQPEVLLLDEATSSLDGTVSHQIVKTLWQLSRPQFNRPAPIPFIVLVIHQPRPLITRFADRLIVMHEGTKVAYASAWQDPPLQSNGRQLFREARTYFQTRTVADNAILPGYSVQEAIAIAQEAIAIAQNADNPNIVKVQEGELPLYDTDADRVLDYANLIVDPESDAIASQHLTFAGAHSWTTHISHQSASQRAKFNVQGQSASVDQVNAATWKSASICNQVRLVLWRDRIQFLHEPWWLVMEIVGVLIAGLFSGIIYGSAWKDEEYVGMALMSVIAFGTIAAVISVRLMGAHAHKIRTELHSGLSLIAYCIGISVLDLVRWVSFPLIFAGFYWLTTAPDTNFPTVLVPYYLVFWNQSGFGFLISTLIEGSNAYLIAALGPLIIGGFMNGVQPTLSGLSPFLQWLSNVSFSKTAVPLLVLDQIDKEPIYQAQRKHTILSRLNLEDVNRSSLIIWLLVLGLMQRLLAVICVASGGQNYWVRLARYFACCGCRWRDVCFKKCFHPLVLVSLLAAASFITILGIVAKYRV